MDAATAFGTPLPGAIRSSSAGPVVAPRPEVTMLGYQGGEVIRQHRRSWTAVSGSLVEIRCDGHLHVDFGSRPARLSAVLEQVGGYFEARASLQRAQTSREIQRPLSLIPAGLQAHAKAAGVLFMRHLVLQFELSELMHVMQGEADSMDSFTLRLIFSDPEVMQFAQLFAAECASDEPQPALYGDSLSVALLLALSRLGKPKRQPTGRGHLAPWQLRRVTEYFAAHLADDIRLQQRWDKSDKLSWSFKGGRRTWRSREGFPSPVRSAG